MYKRDADGVAKKGKTEGKNLGNSGPTAPVEKAKTAKHGVSSMDIWDAKDSSSAIWASKLVASAWT